MRNGYAKCVTYRTGKVTGLVSKKNPLRGVAGMGFSGDDMFVGGHFRHVPPVLLRGGVPREARERPDLHNAKWGVKSPALRPSKHSHPSGLGVSHAPPSFGRAYRAGKSASRATERS